MDKKIRTWKINRLPLKYDINKVDNIQKSEALISEGSTIDILN